MKPAFLLIALSTLTSLAQGDLNPPPGDPTATMKTLDQLESRTPIPPSPATPVAGPHFTITQPGSYYLTGNITVASGDAIVVTAGRDVSIDLKGFTIASTLTGSANGIAISVPLNFTGLTVCHGKISSGTVVPGNGAAPLLAGFASGINVINNDTNATYSAGTIHSECLISDVHVHGCGNDGIDAGRYSIIENCTARNNGMIGIEAFYSSVTACTASNNGTGIGCYYGSITRSTATANINSGISTGFGVAAHCIAKDNLTLGVATYQITSVFGQRTQCLPPN